MFSQYANDAEYIGSDAWEKVKINTKKLKRNHKSAIQSKFEDVLGIGQCFVYCVNKSKQHFQEKEKPQNADLSAFWSYPYTAGKGT